MRSLFRGALTTVLVSAGVFALAAPAIAAETSNSEFVIIREDTEFPGDLYAGAIEVIVDGTLEGDLVAFAAERVVINGTVTGSVMALTPNLEINGTVEGTVRVAGNRLGVSGEVGGDLVGAVRQARLGPSSRVDGDVLLLAWHGSATGSIGGDLTGSQRRLDLAGEIEGNVDVDVGRLSVVDPLAVGGDLGYRSEHELTGLDQATVQGVVVEKAPLPPNIRVRALGILGKFLAVVILAVSALTVAYGWPRRTSTSIAEVGRRPIRRWLTGAAVLFAPLLVAGVTALILGLAPAAVAFPLLAILVPVILALAGFSLALAIVAGTPVVGWLGARLFKRLDLYGSILAGSIIAGVIWWLPLVGWLVPLIVLPLGLGAWIAGRRGQSSSEAPNEESISATS